MSDSYKYDVAAIENSAVVSATIVKELQEALETAKALKEKVEAYGGWKGKQKKELMTFLDLLIPYHKDLVKKTNCPFTQYKKAIKELAEDLETYTTKSKSYKELKSK